MSLQKILSYQLLEGKTWSVFAVCSGCAKAGSSLLPTAWDVSGSEIEKVYIDYVWSEEILIIMYPSN